MSYTDKIGHWPFSGGPWSWGVGGEERPGRHPVERRGPGSLAHPHPDL